MRFDIFRTKTQAIVNPVNCVGVMGAGLAKKFKEEFPENFRAYQRACTEGTVRIGKGCVTKNALPNGRKVFIFNLPTKNHWRDPSTLEYVSKGLDWMVQAVKQLEIKSIAIPRIGCGLGGLNWEDVLPMIKEKVKSMREAEIIVDGEKLGEETSPAPVKEEKNMSLFIQQTPRWKSLAGNPLKQGVCDSIASDLRKMMKNLGFLISLDGETGDSCFQLHVLDYTPEGSPWAINHYALILAGPDSRNYVVDIPMKEYTWFDPKTELWMGLNPGTFKVHVIQTVEDFLSAYPGMSIEEAERQSSLLKKEMDYPLFEGITFEGLQELSDGKYPLPLPTDPRQVSLPFNSVAKNEDNKESKKEVIKYYAGIGSRQTPSDILKEMSTISQQLGDQGYILRSGGAKGADTAFEMSTKEKEIYRPNEDIPEWCFQEVEKYLLGNSSLKQMKPFIQRLLARNMMQIWGRDRKTPVEFVICWTSDGKDSGGTGYAIRAAVTNGIPVYNLKNLKDRKMIQKILSKEKQKEEIQETPANPQQEEGKMKKIRIFTVSMRNGEKVKKYGRVLDITKKSGIQRFTPSWEIIMGLKKKEITWEQYQEEYYRMMRESYRKDPQGWMDTAKDGETIFLMCFCPYPQECHRSLLAGYLEKMYEKKGFLVIDGGEWKP